MNTNPQSRSPNPQLAVVLASGGMDSCVTAAVAARERELAMLHISYGQLTENRESKAFNDIADFYKAERRMTASIAHLARIGGSSLTDRRIEVSQADLESKEVPTSYVPFRHAHLLSIATSWAPVSAAIRPSQATIGRVSDVPCGEVSLACSPPSFTSNTYRPSPWRPRAYGRPCWCCR